MRRFLRPTLRRPLPDFLVPTSGLRVQKTYLRSPVFYPTLAGRRNRPISHIARFPGSHTRLGCQPVSSGSQISFQGGDIGGKALFMEIFNMDGNRTFKSTLAQLAGEGRINLTRSERDVLDASLRIVFFPDKVF